MTVQAGSCLPTGKGSQLCRVGRADKIRLLESRWLGKETDPAWFEAPFLQKTWWKKEQGVTMSMKLLGKRGGEIC